MFNYPISTSKGNPLHENTNLVHKLKEEFQKNENSESLVIKPHFLFWSNEYRTVRIYKISFLLPFFKSFAQILLIQKEILINQSSKSSGSNFNIKEAMKSSLQHTVYIRDIAQFFDIDEDTALNSLTCCFPESFMPKMKTVFSYGTIISIIASYYQPSISIPSSFLLYFLNSISTNDWLKIQRIANFANTLNIICQNAINYKEDIKNSNVLITAVDERCFGSYCFHNSFRRNDGSWCNFVFIKDLAGATKAKDCNNWFFIEQYIDIISQIVSNKNVDIKNLKNKIDSLQ